MVRRDHFSARMGSPPVSCRSRRPIASITAGVFFPPACVHPRLGAHAAVPLLRRTAPVALGPRCVRPAPKTRRPCGRHRSLPCAPPSRHTAAADAHPASYKTESSRLLVPAIVGFPLLAPRSRGLLAGPPAASAALVAALSHGQSIRTPLPPLSARPACRDTAAARAV